MRMLRREPCLGLASTWREEMKNLKDLLDSLRNAIHIVDHLIATSESIMEEYW
jgi:hypothetical protein